MHHLKIVEQKLMTYLLTMQMLLILQFPCIIQLNTAIIILIHPVVYGILRNEIDNNADVTNNNSSSFKYNHVLFVIQETME